MTEQQPKHFSVAFKDMGDGNHLMGVFLGPVGASDPIVGTVVIGALPLERKDQIAKQAIALLVSCLFPEDAGNVAVSRDDGKGNADPKRSLISTIPQIQNGSSIIIPR